MSFAVPVSFHRIARFADIGIPLDIPESPIARTFASIFSVHDAHLARHLLKIA